MKTFTLKPLTGKHALAFLALLICATITPQLSNGQTILAWDFSGLDGSQTTVNSTTTNANLNISAISRGSGLSIPPFGSNRFTDAFNAVSYSTSATSLSAAVTAIDYIQFTVNAKAGYSVSLSTLDANFLRSSTAAPSTFQWQYSLNNFATAGVNIGSAITYTGNFNAGAINGTAQTQISLSGISALQNVSSATTITIRLYGWNATNASSTFALGRLSGNDLTIGGTITSPPCAGTPTGGTVTVTPSSAQPGASYSVTASGYSSGSGLSFQWQSSTDGGSNWSNVGSATSSYAALNQTAGSFGSAITYRLAVTCSNSSITSYSSTATFTSAYCNPTVTNNDAGVVITKVEFVGMITEVTNSSGTNTAAYQDFTGLATKAVQEQGEAVNLNVGANAASTLWKAWVDWNKDGDFTDAGEEVYNSNSTYTLTTSFGFQIPLTQATGDYRIRIRTWDYTSFNVPVYGGSTGAAFVPCGNLNDGQTEDYLFTVTPRCNAGILSVKNDTSCTLSSAVFSLKATGNAQATNFKWYTAQVGGSSIFSGATFTTPALNATTTYWVTATGNNTIGAACESQIRVPVVAYKPTVPTISFDQPNPSYICNGATLSVTGTSSPETAYLINEGFESGTLGSFTVTTVGNNLNTNQKWQVRTSTFIPTMSSVWRPAISSGFGTNKFAFALSDVPTLFGTNYHTFLTSAGVATTGFTSLKLAFNLYFDHYLNDNVTSILDTVTVQTSPDNGSTWNTVTKFIADQGKAADFGAYNYDLYSLFGTAAYQNKASVKVRFVFGASWTNGVAVDSIRLYGDRPASSSYTWTQVGGLIDNCLYTDPAFTTPYAGQSLTQVYLQTTDAQGDDGNPLEFQTTLDLSNGCTAKNSITIDINDKVWTSAAGTKDWGNKSNWCGNKVPAITDRVKIPYLGPGANYPIVRTGIIGKSRFLTIDSAASVTIDDGGKLQIRRDLVTSADAFFTNNGTLELAGSENNVAQNFPGPGTIAEMNNVIINNPRNPDANGNNVILNSPISIRGELTPTAGVLAIGNNDVTLKSYSTTTGSVGIMSNQAGFNYNGTGLFIVERYIGGHRAWRYLTSPVTDTATIRTAWQEGVNNPDLWTNYNPHPGYGMHISGGSTTLGFDVNTTGNPSILTWNEGTQDWNWTAPSTKTTRLDANNGYYTFVRGSRAVNLSQGQYSATDSTRLRAKGTLHVGDYNETLNGVSGHLQIAGNPYASPVNILNVIQSSSGVTPKKFYVYDPMLTNDYGVGGQVTYFNGVMTPGPRTPSFANATAATILQSGQAFLVELQNGSHNLKFKETDKSSTQNNVFGFRMAPEKPSPKVYINLTLPDADSLLLLDGVAAIFGNEYSDSVDYNDALKLGNVYEDMSLVRHGKALAIESRPIPEKTDTLFFNIGNVLSQPYVLQVIPEAVPAAVKHAWLVDNYLKTQTPLKISSESRYTFNTTGDPASYVNRFMIVFTVERKQQTNNSPVAKMSNMDKLSSEGTVTVNPNPVTRNQTAQIRFSNMVKGDYEIGLYNSAGRKLLAKVVNHAGASNAYPLTINPAWAADKYNLVVINKQTGEVKNIPLIINR